jgi:hypothetical protein
MNIKDKCLFIMLVHFPDVKPGRVEDLRCEVCQDFKYNHCQGKNLKKWDVIKCMEEKIELTEFPEINSDSSVH